MLNALKKFFAKSEKKPAGDSVDHDIKVAACSLLLEMAFADEEFSDEERDDIVSILEKGFGLNKEDGDKLMEEAKKELDSSIDLWQFTNMINKNYSKEEKIGVVEMLWSIVYADGIIDKHEDYLLHKLASLLRLSHSELIEAKMKVKNR